jgi:hypothetical protein
MTYQASFLTPAGAVRRSFRELPDDREIQACPEWATAISVTVTPRSVEEYNERFAAQCGFVYRGLKEQR